MDDVELSRPIRHQGVRSEDSNDEKVGVPEEAQKPVVNASEEVRHGSWAGGANDSGWLLSACSDGLAMGWMVLWEFANLDP